MSVTTTVGLDFMLGSITGAARLEDMVAGAMGSGAVRGLTGAVKEAQRKLETAYGQAYVNSIRLGAKEEAKQLESAFNRRQDNIRRSLALRGQLEANLEQIRDRADQALQAASIRRQIDNQNKLIRTQQEGQDRLIMEMNAAQKDRLDLLDQGMQKSAQGFGSTLESGATQFGSIMQTALSAENLNVGDLVKNIGGALKDGAPNMMKFSAQHAGKGGMMGKLAGAMGKLGAAAAVIAGVAAALGAVIALFAAAYGQTKEFNKLIMEGASTVDMLSGNALSSSHAFEKELGNIREAAIDVALEFRSSAEAAIGFASEMNKAGLTFKEQRALFGDYADGMKLALKASQSFGVGGSEVASMMEEMTKNMGMGLKNVEDGFAGIFAASQLSGMGVASFFTSVNEATAGMALMNFRLEDTVELLIGMEKILGEDLAKSQMGGLKGKYADMGFQERYKSTMLAGKAGGRIITTAAENQGEGFAEKLNAVIGGLTGNRKDAAGLGVSNMKSLGGASLLSDDGKNLNLKAIGALKGQDLGLLQNELAAMGPEFEQLARQLGDMSQLARGANTDSTGRRAAALGSLDETSSLAFSMVSALGDRAIGDMEGVDRMAFEEQTGISGQAFEQYQEIFNRLAGRMTAGEEGYEKYKGKEISTSMVAEVIASGGMMSAEDRAALEAAQKAGMSEMETIARNQLKETTSILQTLKNEVVSILNSLNGFLQKIAELFSGEDTVETRKSRAAAYAQQFGDRQDALDEERELLEAKGDYSKTEEFDERQKKITEGVELARQVSRTGDYHEMENLKKYFLQAAGVDLDAGGDLDALGIVGADNMQHVYKDGKIIDPMDALMTPGSGVGWSQSGGFYGEGVETRGVPIYAGDRERSQHYLQIPGVQTGIGYGGRMTSYSDLDDDALLALTEWKEGEATRQAGFGITPIGGPVTDDDWMTAFEPLDPEAQANIAEWLGESAEVEGKELPKQTTELEATTRLLADLKGLSEEQIKFEALTGLTDAGVLGMTTAQMRTSLSHSLSSGTLTGAAAVKAKEDFATYTGESYDDFIYRGKGSHMGTIHPINGQDIVGALPESWAKMGGGVTIGTLTINESGDPNKTFAMVKAAIKAAQT